MYILFFTNSDEFRKNFFQSKEEEDMISRTSRTSLIEVMSRRKKTKHINFDENSGCTRLDRTQT